MKKITQLNVGVATAVLGLALISMPAYAQDTAAQDTTQEDVTQADEADAPASTDAIVVTGTRIVRPTLDSPVPLTTVTVAELTNTGDVSLGDALNDLPSLRSTYGQGNSTRFIGTAGLNILDLRGLGVSRTLTLVNGRRHITASPGDYLVDTNTIPVDLLERVDVVTGGNSAIYGSDAVAGVVNFIMKRNFEGFTVRGQGGISSRGDRGNYFVSATYGKNFADGRGNIAISAEYAKSNPLYFKDRDYLTGAYSGRCQYNQVEPTSAPAGQPVDEPGGTDGIPDTAKLCGVRNGSISDGGTVGGLGNGVFLRFDDNGNLYRDVPDKYIGSFTGNVIGGHGSTLRNTGQLAAGLDRYAFNLIAHYDISDAFRPYVEAKYVHVDALQEGQPSFFQGFQMSCDNAFLTPQSLATLQGLNLCLTPNGKFPFSRFNIDFGGRGEKHSRDTYRVVAGVEGTFNEDWRYDFSLNYGRFESKMKSLNNLVFTDLDGNDDGFSLAFDAVRNGAGQIVCRVNADADPTNDKPGCVPLNMFGVGAPSQEALNFVNTTSMRREKAEEFVAAASISGDFSQMFELPGGPVAFALGAEYREETAFSEYDDLVEADGTFLNAIQPFAPPKLTVKEAYAEINIPLLKDMTFAKELSIGAAARVSDYNTRTGTVWAYNVQGIYAPIPDIRFRAAYASSVRAPTQSDLYSTFSENFAQLTDPCDSSSITANPNRAANCAAAGVPTTYNAATVTACASTPFAGAVGDSWRNCLARASSTGYLSGGNENLVAERGKSLTLGVVFEPSFIPGLNFTVDYYRIKVKNLIASLSAQTILNSCYDNAGGIDNVYCASIQRDAATGMFIEPALLSSGINYAAQKTQGLDFDLSYRRTFDNGHKLSVRAIATRVLEITNYTNPQYPNVPNRQLGEIGDPKLAANFSVGYDTGGFDVVYSVQYIGKQSILSWETQHPYKGICPSNGLTGYTNRPCTKGELVMLDPANLDANPDVYFGDAWYHNLRMGFTTADKKFNFYVGVDNLLDRKPPFGQLGTTSGEPWDTFGRYFYTGIKANF